VEQEHQALLSSIKGLEELLRIHSGSAPVGTDATQTHAAPRPLPPGGGVSGAPAPPPEPAACAPIRKSGKGTFVGMVSEDVFAGGPNYRSCTLNTQLAGGVSIIRFA